jgi:hypothetical protein
VSSGECDCSVWETLFLRPSRQGVALRLLGRATRKSGRMAVEGRVSSPISLTRRNLHLCLWMSVYEAALKWSQSSPHFVFGLSLP